MAEATWRDHHLSDIVEAQFVLFVHFSLMLDRAGLVPRDWTAQTIRETAANDDLRPGVRSYLDIIAGLLEHSEPIDAGPVWKPRVVTGGADPNGAADPEQGRGNGQAGNSQAGNGHGGNGHAGQGWRPTLVGDDDPDRT